jgi:hypothetical protein
MILALYFCVVVEEVAKQFKIRKEEKFKMEYSNDDKHLGYQIYAN